MEDRVRQAVRGLLAGDAAEYIIEPAFHGWARGVCQRCGKDQKLTTFKRYTMSKRGLEKRWLLDEQ